MSMLECSPRLTQAIGNPLRRPAIHAERFRQLPRVKWLWQRAINQLGQIGPTGSVLSFPAALRDGPECQQREDRRELVNVLTSRSRSRSSKPSAMAESNLLIRSCFSRKFAMS
jgi:hypothetical protein